MVRDTRPGLAEALDLAPHPEGGWYRRTWTSSETVTLPDGRVRPTATMIQFLLVAGESSAWHRISSEELWIAQVGDVVLEHGGVGPSPVASGEVLVGLGDGASTQAVVPAGAWQRTRPSGVDALVTCVVSPGFDFEDFELA